MTDTDPHLEVTVELDGITVHQPVHQPSVDEVDDAIDRAAAHAKAAYRNRPTERP